MRLFLYRKEVTSSVESVHENHFDADAWARWHCHSCYGELYDVSDDYEVRMSVGVAPAYGPRTPWQANVFYVTLLSAITRGPPPYVPRLPDEEEEEESEADESDESDQDEAAQADGSSERS